MGSGGGSDPNMSIQGLGGALGDYLGSSLAAPMNALSLKPVSSGWLASLFHTMVPTGYSKLQEERLAMVDLAAKPEAAESPPHHQNGYRHLDRASRSSVTLSDCGDAGYSETEPMLAERRPSGDGEGEDGEDEDEGDEERGSMTDGHNMPKESPLAMALQILVPFLLAGFGTVSAGMVLDVVQVRSESCCHRQWKRGTEWE